MDTGGGRGPAGHQPSGHLPNSLDDDHSSTLSRSSSKIGIETQYDSTRERQPQIDQNIHKSEVMADVYARYGIKRGDEGVAKLIASKVAINAFPVPTMEMLQLLNPSQVDLANALELTTGFVVDQCERLTEGHNKNAGAFQYTRIWKPIFEEGAANNKIIPASSLRYLLWLSLLAAEEVHEWANIGSTPIEDRKTPFSWPRKLETSA